MNSIGDDGIDAISGYEQVTYLRRGGTATLYSARMADDGATVVLKVFDTDQNSAADRQWSIANRLDGVSGALPALDRHTLTDGRTVVVLPYVAGGSLADHIMRFGAMPESDVARMGELLASTLQASHDAGVLHRDLKPSNVLLGDDGSPILCDFDAATNIDVVTATETMALTILYAAPEVLRGSPADVRSDIYSLGLTLQAAAIGSAPFSDANLVGLAPLVDVICNSGVPKAVDSGVSPALSAVLQRATSVDPQDRYGSPAELAAALRGLHDDGITSPSAMTSADSNRWSTAFDDPIADRGSGRRRTSLILATVLVCAIAIGAVLIWSSSRPEKSELVTAAVGGSGQDTVPNSSGTIVATKEQVDDADAQVTDGNGVLGPLFQIDDFTYQGRMSRECQRSERWVAFSIHADQDDRAGDVREPWIAVKGPAAGTFMAYLPCENGGRDIRFVLRAPGRWFTVVATFPQDQYDRMVAWMRENETSPAPDYTVDDEIRETLADQGNYLGFDIIDRAE